MSRSRSRSPSRSRRHSPERRYICSAPKFPTTEVVRGIPSLSKRYKELYIPSDFSRCAPRQSQASCTHHCSLTTHHFRAVVASIRSTLRPDGSEESHQLPMHLAAVMAVCSRGSDTHPSSWARLECHWAMGDLHDTFPLTKPLSFTIAKDVEASDPTPVEAPDSTLPPAEQAAGRHWSAKVGLRADLGEVPETYEAPAPAHVRASGQCLTSAMCMHML